MPSHEHYCQISTLVALGEEDTIAEQELIDWKRHRDDCKQCQELGIELRATALVLTTAPARTHLLPAQFVPSLIAEAEKRGVRFQSRETPKARPDTTLLVWAMAATVALIVTIAFIFLYSRVPFSRVQTAGRIVPAAPTSAPQDKTSEAQIQDLQNQLLAAHSKEEKLTQNLRSRQKTLEDSQQRVTELTTRVSELEQAGGRATETIAQLKQQLEKLQSQREADRNASLVEEGELQALRSKTALLTQQLNNQQRLDRTALLARDLIVARNLVIKTVQETDETGKVEKPFGRVFYKEGQRLVFYAYDLPSLNGAKSPVSYYLWAEKTSPARSVTTLGVLQVDDPSDARWIFRDDDSQILRNLSRVFITAEKDNTPLTKPTGKQWLSTRLDVPPNQP